MQFNDKIENLALYVKNLIALASDIKAEEQNLKSRRESAEKKAENLKERIKTYLDGMKFETAKCSIGYRKSEKVIVEDDAELPEDYLKVTVKSEPNKTEIKQALKSGIKIAGCRLEECNNIQIK